ncbi:AAA family ATPase [Imperialibacter roseus]|uniref:AAA family ATPase n=1 Tax=Imperialibacter roseus TaxID=1324217 RepID=A0ABZ0IXU3_9BACT|nr:AAA family ATPase [Imperialibacter roseus]WOK09203.1 AAA family ATPase [Imperialibacter roseus]
MRIDKVHIKTRFKNLEDFQIDIDENAWETVLLGLNATGKSNFLEALVIIFRDLDLIYNHNRKAQQPFDYYIKYECRGNAIEITFEKGKYAFVVNGKTETTAVTKNIEHYLPKHVFIYYSGISDRLADLYIPHQKIYYEQIIKAGAKIEEFDTIRRIFLAQNIHANFALIAFYLFKEEQGDETIRFLQEELKITDFGSALFMLKEPDWAKSRADKNAHLWGADGLVEKFVNDLLLFSYAPIQHKARVEVSYKKNETQDRLYLYLRDKSTFLDLAEDKYKNKIVLFNALESIHISDMLHDVKIKVQKEGVDGELSMSELSEGEKQLLTVLGLLKFTKDEESLILLDEPDTHLNPMWKWKFLDYLDRVVKRKENTQIIFCSHDPLVIGNMVKSQVQLFKVDPETKKTKTESPKADPKGMGVAGILTSDLFDLPTTLDSDTQQLLDERNELLFLESENQLNDQQEQRLKELYEVLNSAGFSQIFKDPLYSEFVIAYQKYLRNKKESLLGGNNEIKSKALEIVNKMMKKKS